MRFCVVAPDRPGKTAQRGMMIRSRVTAGAPAITSKALHITSYHKRQGLAVPSSRRGGTPASASAVMALRQWSVAIVSAGRCAPTVSQRGKRPAQHETPARGHGSSACQDDPFLVVATSANHHPARVEKVVFICAHTIKSAIVSTPSELHQVDASTVPEVPHARTSSRVRLRKYAISIRSRFRARPRCLHNKQQCHVCRCKHNGGRFR